MPRDALNAAGQIGGEEQRKHRHEQQQGKVTQPHRRRVEHHRVHPRRAIAVNDEHEARQRHQRVRTLPPRLAQAGVHPVAPRGVEDGYRVRAEKQQQAEDEQGHGGISGSGSVRLCRSSVIWSRRTTCCRERGNEMLVLRT